MSPVELLRLFHYFKLTLYSFHVPPDLAGNFKFKLNNGCDMEPGYWFHMRHNNGPFCRLRHVEANRSGNIRI